MSRAAVFNLLANDSQLNSIGFDVNSIHHNYTLEERPNDTPFIILQWGTEDPPPFDDPDNPTRSAERLSLWMHFPVTVTEDFSEIKHGLDRCDTVFRAARDIVGNDGYTLSFVRIIGRSSDFRDPGYETISRNAGYEIYYR